jgi:hypothetical protein
MAGGGYEIPISVSTAHSFSVPQNVAAPTIFNFGSGDVSGGRFDTEQSPFNPVTATASTAQGQGATAQAATPITPPGDDNKKLIIILAIAGGVLLVGGLAAIFYFKGR